MKRLTQYREEEHACRLRFTGRLEAGTMSAAHFLPTSGRFPRYGSGRPLNPERTWTDYGSEQTNGKNPDARTAGIERAANFDEVALGYTAEMALNEAARCLHCKNRPCVTGCPVNVQIPDFIAKIAEGDFEGAYQTIRETNALPAVCGRVCPQENQCESKCVRGLKGGAGRHRPAGAVRRRYPPAEYSRAGRVPGGAKRPPGGGDRLRSRRPDLRGRSVPPRIRGDGI